MHPYYYHWPALTFLATLFKLFLLILWFLTLTLALAKGDLAQHKTHADNPCWHPALSSVFRLRLIQF